MVGDSQVVGGVQDLGKGAWKELAPTRFKQLLQVPCFKGGICLSIHGDNPNDTSSLWLPQVPGGSITPGCHDDVVVLPMGFRSLLLSKHCLRSPCYARAGFQGQYLLIVVLHIFFPSLLFFFSPPLPPLFALPESWGHPQLPPISSRKAADRFSIMPGPLIPRAASQAEALINARKFSHSLCAY